MKPLRKADQKVRRSKAIREVREDWPRACWISEQFRSTPGTSGPAPIGYGCVIAAQTGMSQPDAEKRVNDSSWRPRRPPTAPEKGPQSSPSGWRSSRTRFSNGARAERLDRQCNGDDCPIGPAASSASRSPLPQRNKPYRVRSRGLESRPVKPLLVLDNFPVALLIV
jgi:hypothetical protein